MTRTTIVSFFLLCIAISGCGTVSIASKPAQKISRQAKITVVSPSQDPQNIAGQLEHLLLSQGFEVRSEVVGSNQVEYKETQVSDQGSKTTSGVVRQVTVLPADLVFRFSYNAYFDLLYWSFTRFNGSVVDLDTGTLIMSVTFTGDRSVSSVLNDFAKQLSGMAE